MQKQPDQRGVEQYRGAIKPEQLAFELNAYLQMADLVFQLGDPDGIGRGRAAIRTRLDNARPARS